METLSDKSKSRMWGNAGAPTRIYVESDVKQFIKDLKEESEKDVPIFAEYLSKQIDKLAGEKLI